MNSFVPHNLGSTIIRFILYVRGEDAPTGFSLSPAPLPLPGPEQKPKAAPCTQWRGCHAPHRQNRRWWGLQTQTCCRHTAICSSFQPTRLVLTVISSQTGGETVNRLRVIPRSHPHRPPAPALCPGRTPAPPAPQVLQTGLGSQARVSYAFPRASQSRASPPCLSRRIVPRGFRGVRKPVNLCTLTHPRRAHATVH